MKMISFIIFSYVWFLICSEENSSALIRFSVPEDHHVCLRCGASDRSRVVWTHRDRDRLRVRVVPVTEHGSDDASEEQQRHLLLSDGGLCLLRLHESDGGEYQCDGELEAELQVLTGLDFAVSSGRTLLVPCSHSPRPRRRWFRRRRGGRRVLIFTRFRNGTSRPEGEGGSGRLRFENDALQIQDLQPGDAGEYQCNGELQARLSVLTVHPEPTSRRPTSPATSVAVTTGLVESKEKKKTTERTLLTVAVVGFGLMIVLMSVVCVLLSSVSCRRRRRSHAAARRRDDTELQPRTTLDAPTEWEESQMIHYASLGRPDWSQRASRTPPDQDRDRVIYSSVITRPNVGHTPVT